MIQLRKIGEKNFRDILNLCVRDDQKSFVAPNDISLIEAFIAISHHGKAFPFENTHKASEITVELDGSKSDLVRFEFAEFS